MKPINEKLDNRIDKIVKDDVPGCCSYRETEAFYKTSFTESPIKWPLGKARRVTYTQQVAERKQTLPSPAQYFPEKADKVNTIGARGKLGYYNKVF